MSLKTISFIAILFVVVLFAVQNSQVVEVRFLIWKMEASRAIVLLITFSAGLLGGWLSGFRRKTPTREKNRL